ncbi:MAG: hypothetical protein IKE65_03970 [Clostridia bacterium]|nr:hypothetical protein [Clostridia bacterium]
MLLGEISQQKDDLRFALKRLMRKFACLAVLGVALTALWLYISATRESVGVEVLSIMGWVCVWEATTIFIIRRPELMRSVKNLERLLQAEIRFKITD